MRGRGCGHAPNRYANWVQAQPARLNKANENFDLQKRAQPKASDLRESVQSRPAGGPFAKWVQAQPTRLNKANENFDLHKRAQPKASDLRESVQSRPAGGPFAKWVQAQPA